jgi:hypothetical protein
MEIWAEAYRIVAVALRRDIRPAQELGRYLPESRPILLTLSFVVHDPNRTSAREPLFVGRDVAMHAAANLAAGVAVALSDSPSGGLTLGMLRAARRDITGLEAETPEARARPIQTAAPPSR